MKETQQNHKLVSLWQEPELLNLQKQILSQVIGSRATSSLSKKMGYSFNQVARWEQLQKRMTWQDFVRLCSVTSFPLDRIIFEVFGAYYSSSEELTNLFPLTLLKQAPNREKVLRGLRISRTTLYRLERSPSKFEMWQILALVNQRPRFLRKFKNELFGVSERLDYSAARSIFSIPWISAVSAAMAHPDHLKQPSFNPQWISAKLGLSLGQVAEAVQVMLENKLIQWNGHHYEPTLPRTLTLRRKQSREEFFKSLEFWSARSNQKIGLQIQKSDAKKMTGVFRVFMTSAQNVEKINTLIAQLEEKIHKLLSQTPQNKKTEMRAFVFTHFDITEE